jgi:hypothetical protein
MRKDDGIDKGKGSGIKVQLQHSEVCEDQRARRRRVKDSHISIERVVSSGRERKRINSLIFLALNTAFYTIL